MLWRPSACGALRPLDSDGPPGTRLGRPLLSALGIPRRVHRTAAPGDTHLHRAAGGNRAHAARTLSHLHVSGVVALVPRSGLSRHEGGRELARAGEIFPQVRRADRGGAGSGRSLFCLDSLAEQDRASRGQRSVTISASHTSSVLLASCDPTICHLPLRFTTTSM